MKESLIHLVCILVQPSTANNKYNRTAHYHHTQYNYNTKHQTLAQDTLNNCLCWNIVVINVQEIPTYLLSATMGPDCRLKVFWSFSLLFTQQQPSRPWKDFNPQWNFLIPATCRHVRSVPYRHRGWPERSHPELFSVRHPSVYPNHEKSAVPKSHNNSLSSPLAVPLGPWRASPMQLTQKVGGPRWVCV
jgi:hypothetical protein